VNVEINVDIVQVVPVLEHVRAQMP